MPVIPIQNGTTSITVECASLTRLEYDSDDNVYRCEFSDWAFGLFAILAVSLFLVPVVLVIHCWIKWYHKQHAKNFRPSFSTQTSYSSLYPQDYNHHTDLEDVLNEEPGVVYHHPQKKRGKAYFPYPAYGTHDDNSLPGSTTSLYYGQGEMDSGEPKPSSLSNSAPVVSSMLTDCRNHLHASQQAEYEEPDRISSLDNENSHPSEPSLFRKEREDAESLKSISRVKKGTSLSDSLTLSDATPESIRQNDTIDGGNSNRKNLEQLLSPTRPSDNTPKKALMNRRIVSATPPSNMLTRQDFDDYLADCVLKLPEGQRNGTFLIRNSTTVPNCKVLTLYSKSLENNASLYYYKIFYNDDQTMYLENTHKTFEDMDVFINFYRENRSVLPCLLAECLGRHF